ncbi:MAG: hypothetical protein IJI66_01865 [Erysipelotrichaceae bacterium]|nr:hypothetical protein [Erysipelotrichaceae bacterium]
MQKYIVDVINIDTYIVEADNPSAAKKKACQLHRQETPMPVARPWKEPFEILADVIVYLDSDEIQLMQFAFESGIDDLKDKFVPGKHVIVRFRESDKTLFAAAYMLTLVAKYSPEILM